MTENERIAITFAEQFDPPLKYIRTARVNNVPMHDAWQITYWDSARSIGITAAVFNGQIHAFLEAAGPGSIAADAGQAMARAMGLRNAPGGDNG